MASNPTELNSSDNLSRTGLWASGLSFTAWGLFLLSFIWAVTELWTVWTASDPEIANTAAIATLRIVTVLIAAWGGALMMGGFAHLLRRWDPAITSEPDLTTHGMSPAQFDRLLRTIHEVRDVALLDDDQRHQRSEQERVELIKSLQQRLPQLLQRHEWVEARRRITEAQQRFPNTPELEKLATNVEGTIEQAETHDVEQATREINDLIALGAWDRVNVRMRDLLARHPNAAGARALVERITHERDRAQLRERSRLMAQAQSATDARNWTEAVRLAEELIDRFPSSIEADALQQQLQTLQANAEVQVRQKMEGEIHEMLVQKRFSDALAVARTLIERYPSSPQADALRDQLTKLEQRAAEQQHAN